MAKIVRVYLSTFIDVDIDENEYQTKEEMIDYATSTLSDQITKDELYENVAIEPLDVEVVDL